MATTTVSYTDASTSYQAVNTDTTLSLDTSALTVVPNPSLCVTLPIDVGLLSNPTTAPLTQGMVITITKLTTATDAFPIFIQ
ncbi:UNVERIFIED_CONTAM: hypothetical protein HDU68_012241, partial [Siphonaria sp. JEL0065]